MVVAKDEAHSGKPIKVVLDNGHWQYMSIEDAESLRDQLTMAIEDAKE